MTVEASLYTRLSTWPALLALVSDRVYPMILPQNCTLPAVTYQRIASQPRVLAMGTDPGMARPRFQITAWAVDFDTARAVIDVCRLALERWRSSGSSIDDGYVVMELDNYDPETLEYSSIIDVLIAHRETV